MKCEQARVETLTFHTVTKLEKMFMYFYEETCPRLNNVKLKGDMWEQLTVMKKQVYVHPKEKHMTHSITVWRIQDYK